MIKEDTLFFFFYVLFTTRLTDLHSNIIYQSWMYDHQHQLTLPTVITHFEKLPCRYDTIDDPHTWQVPIYTQSPSTPTQLRAMVYYIHINK